MIKFVSMLYLLKKNKALNNFIFMANNKINYQYVAFPVKMLYAMDNNCMRVLATLMTIKPQEDGSIIMKGNFLAERCSLSPKVTYNAIKGLQEKGVIEVKVSRVYDQEERCFKTKPTTFKIIPEKFQEYDKYEITDLMYNEALRIETKKYFKQKSDEPQAEEIVEEAPVEEVVVEQRSVPATTIKVPDIKLSDERKEAFHPNDSILKSGTCSITYLSPIEQYKELKLRIRNDFYPEKMYKIINDKAKVFKARPDMADQTFLSVFTDEKLTEINNYFNKCGS